MLNLITNQQMRMADAYTCENLKIPSVDLMEKAAIAFIKAFISYCNPEREVYIIVGKGNNGGDGLAIARLLHQTGFKNIKVYILEKFNSESNDFVINYERLKQTEVPILHCTALNDLPPTFDVAIDAILGSGFNRELDLFFTSIFKHINTNSNFIVSVDVPSGCNVDSFNYNSYNGIRAQLTISFQRPKFFFTLPESQMVTEDFEVVDIGLSQEYIQSITSEYLWVDKEAAKSLLPRRKKFTHKGTYGHVLVCAGSPHMRGASLLCAKAVLKTGAGLITLLTNSDFFPFANVLAPELMTKNINQFKDINLEKFSSIAIGPGLGTDEKAKELVHYFLRQNTPLVLDADALNVLQLEDFPKNPHESLIITPHVNEFDRLFGQHESWYERLQTAKMSAEKLKIIIVLKNQYTYICTPNGKVFINSTGNPAMAQGGMGDALTGCIAALLARGLNPQEAAILGCFIHGYTGDKLAQHYEVVSPSLLIDNLPKSLLDISKVE
ncbi:NAD(P)H-hydrate dehydratase [Sphingobacterium sp. SGL-16]|uniref:NAD(P)H-hydrate dehydratase n=1 Tax=Sphingobacterium sp. SGL-16 TaxID=2710883 RepID=UPI0013EAEA16|nr:NAD(P)H-hydrate dehydratase [Sphingobacterium sp. SGL-16]NGM72030.1 NAD(P)H-hydrate dehydratase [Sphingobacterium sp. SGL-16]